VAYRAVPWGKGAVTYRRAAVGMVGLAMIAGVIGIRREDPGPIVWTLALNGSPVDVAMDVHAGRAFVATGDSADNGHVSVLDTHSGTLLRTVAVGSSGMPLSLSVDEHTGRTFVLNQANNTVRVLDARSG